MAYRDLRHFIETLEREGELRRITVEVDPELEIAEIVDRVSKRFGPALLFERVKGSSLPLLINAFGNECRMNLALEAESLDAVAERVQEIVDFETPEGILGKMKMLPKLAELGGIFPRTVRSGPCQEVVRTGDEVDLTTLPVMKCWPKDAGRFFTLPLVFTKNPENGKRNCGMYRMQLFDRNTTAMHWQMHHHGAHHHRLNEAAGRRTEVAVALGGDPATIYSAIAPLPDDLDEMMFAGFVRRKPVEMVPCKTVDLEVPANAEIVLEGHVEPGERRTEGPFGDHTGFYTPEESFPVFRVSCLTHRAEPIYPSTIVGIPPQEDCHMGRGIERIFLPLIRKQMPEIVDMHLPWAGVFHNLVIVSIRKRFPGHARKIMSAIWGLGQMMFSKVVVVVDDDTDVHDAGQVAWRVLNNIDPERDMQFTLGPIDVLDHASRLLGYGSKVGIDGTRKWPGEGHTRVWPEQIRMDDATRALVDRRWGEYGVD